MNIAIVDDQLAESRLLSKYIDNYIENHNFNNVSISVFCTADEYLNAMKKNVFEISFLDILMDSMNGVDLARRIREIDKSTKIIFCTSSNEYAMESYEVGASQYLLKPYTYQQLEMILKKFLPVDENQNMTICIDDATFLPKDILYTEYYNHKVTVHFINKQTMDLKIGQAELMEALKPYKYIHQANRGIMVNIYEIKAIESYTLIMKDNSAFPVSRSHVSDIRKQVKALKKGNSLL